MVTRYPAVAVRLKDLADGVLVLGNKEEKKPTKIITRWGEEVIRVKIVGTVVEKFVSETNTYGFLDIDDGSAAVRVKTFNNTERLNSVDVGDIVLVIGKIREYLDDFYINMEILRKVDEKYELYHCLRIISKLKERMKIINELKNYYRALGLEKTIEIAKESYSMNEEVAKAVIEKFVDREKFKEKILKLIEELQNNEGIEASKIIEMTNLPQKEIEKLLNEMLEEGLIYEIMPGMYKKV